MGAGSIKSIELLRSEADGGHDGRPALKRSLGVLDLTAFGVGNTVGAGIFVLTGTVAATHAGPAVTYSFLIASIACFFAGLCYAEFAAMVPVAGSAYSYAYATFGELMAWIIGWCIMFEYVFSASLVAIGWSGYVTSSLHDLGVNLPMELTSAPFKALSDHEIVRTGAWLDLPAVLVIMACTGLLIIGTRKSSVVNSVIVIIKVAAILLLVVACVKYINPANWHPFVPPNTGESGSFGWSGVFRGAAVVFFAYIGFDGVSTLAEEARDPKRTVPISLFAALAICTALYIAMSLVITGLGDYHQLNVPDPVYKALDLAHANLQWLKYTVATVAVIGMVSVILLSLLGQVRILFAMGRDGLLPPVFARCSERFNTPHIGTIITGGAAALFAAFLPLDILNDLISIGTLLAFALVCLGIIVLRAKRPDAVRPFRTPLVPLVPLLGAGTCFFLMASLPLIAWERLVLWLALGFAIYFGYGRRHSKLAGKE